MRYKSPEHQLLRSLRQSLNLKVKHGWTEETPPKFSDIEDAELIGRGVVKVVSKSGSTTAWLKDLSVQDTKKLIEYVEKKRLEKYEKMSKEEQMKEQEQIQQEQMPKQVIIFPKNVFDEEGKLIHRGDDSPVSLYVKRTRKLVQLVEETFTIPFSKKTMQEISRMRAGSDKERRLVDMLIDVQCEKTKPIKKEVKEEYPDGEPIFMWG